MAKERLPQAKLDVVRFAPFSPVLNADVTELIILAVLAMLLPLFIIGNNLPIAFKVITLGAFPAIGFMLIVVSRQGHPGLYWLTKMVPFWFRQRRWREVSADARVTPEIDRSEDVLSTGVNAISFAWQTDADGQLQLHVYEEPLRPYRAWIAADGRPSGLTEYRWP
jgi:hypothetical protein